MSRTCAACGGVNPEAMKFCGHCGRALDEGFEDPLRRFVSRQVADRIAETGGDISDEWRLVTSLFADISGYVALGERLDPEQLVDATGPIVALMTEVAQRYEGHVARFAGDALLCLFGAPVAHEDDAERALSAALDMRSEVSGLRGSLPPEARDLTLHIGVNTGRVVAALFGGEERLDYNVMGDAVNMAQRLESAAPGGEIYVGDPTVRLARDRFEFERIGEVQMKGKTLPVLAWRLLGERRRPLKRPEGGRLVGRRGELASLVEVFAGLLDGAGCVVAVVGEPGVGKTRLSNDAAGRIRPKGVGWLESRAVASTSGAAYRPFADLIRAFARIEPDDAAGTVQLKLAASLRSAGASSSEPYFAALLGVDDSLTHLSPEALRRGLHAAFVAWARALAVSTPTVLALEDTHWADPSSLDLAVELAAECNSSPLALYLTGRPEASRELQRILDAAPSARRRLLDLSPFDESETAELADHFLGSKAPQALAGLVWERAGGNPFFVEEIIRSLQDSGTLAAEAGEWVLTEKVAAADVPPTIEGVLSARIDALPQSAASLLQTCAVIGRHADVRLLREVARDVTDLDGALARLTASGFLDRVPGPQPGVQFHHALVLEVAYSRLLRRRRAELHLAVADAYERLEEDEETIDERARHLYLAGAGERAIDALTKAGERAKRIFANDTAILHFERAAELAADPSALRLELADLHELRGDYEAALELYEEVRTATGDVRAWRGIAGVHRKRGEYATALEGLNRALAEGQDPAAMWLEHGWTLSVAGRYAEAIASLRKGLETAGDDLVGGQILLELARAETVERDLDAAYQHGTAAQRIFEQHDDTRSMTAAMRIVGATAQRLGRLDESAAVLRNGLALAERTGSVEEMGACLINLGMVELERGALAEAIACDRRAIEEFERIGHGSGRAIGYGNLAEKLLQDGQLPEARRWCEKALEHARSIGHTPTIADATRTLAGVDLAERRFDDAERNANEAARIYDEMGIDVDAADARRIAAEARMG